MTDTATLNRQLVRALPAIREDLAETLSIVEPRLNAVADRVAELRDYLAFEVEKARLALDRAEWDSRSDAAGARAHLQRLVELHEMLNEKDALATVTFLKGILGAFEIEGASFVSS